MNIYALEGHKVKCETFNAGYDIDKEKAIKYLEVGKEYIVEYTIVGGSYTDVFLIEFPNISFNSVFFEDVTEQTKEEDMQHSDYELYN